jgi:nitroimidazol reductase NimA-like FMN-containing flavoprotein (pyridoxamine 5'-phosphate oxidase superfamily)
VLDIDEMGSKEIDDLLQKIEYGHLGCTSQGYPYVVPMQFYFENPNLYIFTTEGMKTRYIDSNPEVCLQVEEIHDLSHWRSIIVTGRAYRLTDQQEFTHAMQLIKAKNPELSPALSRTWIDAWGRENIIVIYRIYPNEMTGRTTQGVSSQS